MEEKFKRLGYAKEACRSILDNADCLVDFHGLIYWAGEVEKLRREIKENL